MSEKEKMLNKKLYDGNDSVLLKERINAKSLCKKFNDTNPKNIKRQKRLINSLLGKVGDNCFISSPFWCDYGYNIEIGENFYSNHNLIILDCAKVTIGKNVFVGPNCGFYTAGHPIDYERRNKYLEYAYPIKIGDNVWIGGGVHIMPGVTIGSNVVIGGGSVVVHDIPDNSIAVGNPCRVIKKITDKDIIKDYNE